MKSTNEDCLNETNNDVFLNSSSDFNAFDQQKRVEFASDDVVSFSVTKSSIIRKPSLLTVDPMNFSLVSLKEKQILLLRSLQDMKSVFKVKVYSVMFRFLSFYVYYFKSFSGGISQKGNWNLLQSS